MIAFNAQDSLVKLPACTLLNGGILLWFLRIPFCTACSILPGNTPDEQPNTHIHIQCTLPFSQDSQR